MRKDFRSFRPEEGQTGFRLYETSCARMRIKPFLGNPDSYTAVDTMKFVKLSKNEFRSF